MKQQAADEPDREDPATGTLQSLDELGADREGDRTRLGDSRCGKRRRPGQARERATDVGPVTEREPGRQEPESGRGDAGSDCLNSRTPGSGDDGDNEEHEGPERDRVVEELPDGVQEAGEGGQELGQRPLDLTRWIRNDEQSEAQQGKRGDQRVRRPPRGRAAFRGCVETRSPPLVCQRSLELRDHDVDRLLRLLFQATRRHPGMVTHADWSCAARVSLRGLVSRLADAGIGPAWHRRTRFRPSHGGRS